MSEELLKDIAARLEAIGESVSEERIRGIVGEELGKLAPAERKMRFGGDQKIVGSKFSRWDLNSADVEFLYDMQTSLRGQRRVNGSGVYGGPSEELENAFGEISDAQYMTADEVRKIDRQAIDDLFPRVTKRNMRAYEAAVRAMDTAESGYGTQLVGAQYVGDLWQAARHGEPRLQPAGHVRDDCADGLSAGRGGHPGDAVRGREHVGHCERLYHGQDRLEPGERDAAKKFIIHQVWSGEMDEDSIIPFVPFLRRQAQLSLAHYSRLAGVQRRHDEHGNQRHQRWWTPT